MRAASAILAIALCVASGTAFGSGRREAFHAPSIFSSSEVRIARQVPPWLVTVSSEYLDSATGGVSIVKGLGTLFRSADGRAFVITASHVSGGASLRVNAGMKVLGRVSDFLDDLELIEVDASRVAPATIGLEFDGIVELPYARDAEGVFVGLSRDGSYWAPVPEFVAATPQAFDFNHIGFSSSAYQFGLTASALEYSSPARIEPGMSGGPLLRRQSGTGSFRLAGVTKRVLRHTSRSFFSTGTQVSALISAYRQGVRGEMVPGQWHYRHGLLFVAFDDGTVEVRLDSVNGGNGTSKDGGNGTSKDGGRSSAQVWWKQLQNRPGILWKGQPTIGFRAVPKADGKAAFNLQADAGALQFMRLYSNEYSFTPTGVDAGLKSLLQDRMGFHEESFLLTSAIGEAAIHVQGDQLTIAIAALELNDVITAQIDLKKSFQPVVRGKGRSGLLRKREYFIDVRGLFFVDAAGSRASDDSFIEDELGRAPVFLKYAPTDLSTEESILLHPPMAR